MNKVDDGVFQFTVPMPMALREVHVYALETDDGWVLIDSGFPSEEALAQLTAEIDRHLGGIARIRTIIITHFHPDHSGLAGWIQERSGCEVVIHRSDGSPLEQMADGIESGHGFASMAHRAGVSFDEMRALFRGVDVPIARPSLVEGGETIEVGGRAVQLVWTPGHTAGHLCVLDSRAGVLFTGDHLLARITPHVGRFHSEGRNPLHEFEDSLALVERMAPRRALPAHETSIENPAGRCRELLQHHRDRREQVLAEIGTWSRTADEVAEKIFRGREGGMHRMLALSETEAHLEALVAEGILEHLEDPSGVAYTLRGRGLEHPQSEVS